MLNSRLPEPHIARAATGLAVAVVIVMVFAFGVIFSVHTSRQMVNELQSLQRESDRMQVEWGQLLLEKSAWGSYAQIERTARDELDMYVPTVKEIVVVSP